MTKRRIINRILFHTGKKLLKVVSLFNHRLYMRYYIPFLRRFGMSIYGTPRYIGINVVFDDFDLIALGNNVVISDECHFLTHDYSYTTGMRAIGKTFTSDIAIKKSISIGDNVFIGKKTIIMPGCTVGDNVIIGAGSVIRGSLDSNFVYTGNPAQKIKSIDQLAKKWEKVIESDSLKIDENSN